MNQLLRVDTPASGQTDEAERYRYGWRYVRRKLPDGTEDVELVPLSQEDLLYPREDDFVVQKPPHWRDFEYCHGTLERVHTSQPGVVVLGDCLVDWGVEGVQPLGPDVLVLFDVRQWLQRGTFRIAEEGGRPILALEIASPSTRVHDVGAKLNLYYRAGVQLYVIIDRGPDGEDPVRLLGYRRGPQGWLPLEPDAQGRLNLAPVGVWLGVEENRPWLYDAATGQRLLAPVEMAAALAEAEIKARQDAQARADAEARVRDAEAKAREETQARSDLEKRLRELEDQLRRQRDQSGS